jgi:MFS family permease
MLAAPFSLGVGIYIFYALQPYLLKLYGDEKAYTIAGLVAALVSIAQVAGGMLAPYIRTFFKRRTSAILLAEFLTAAILLSVAFTHNFWIALVLIFIWGLLFAAIMPIRQAYLNGEITSEHRATVLSFDALMASSGGIVIQPALGKVADIWGYSSSFAAAAVIQLSALPFIAMVRKYKAPSDIIKKERE